MNPNESRRWGVVLWFSLMALLSLILHLGTGRFVAQSQPDSESYLSFDWSSVDTIFRGIRTPGYPIFLKLVVSFFGVAFIPFAHWLAMVASVYVWYRGLRQTGFQAYWAFWASAPLLFSSATWELGQSIASDSLGMVLCIAGCGFFLSAISNTARWWNWVLLGAVTLAAILVRPAYLFLLPLWPILAAWVTFFVLRASREKRIHRIIFAGLASLVPFLGYCSLRAGLVGEFGLVSFGGYNLIGITGQFITYDDLVELEGRELELAKRMIEKRDRVTDYAPPESYATMVRLYNATVWTTAAPAAEELFGSDVETSNRTLKSLALKSLNVHRSEYFSWLLNNGKSMVEQLLRGTLVDCGSRLALFAVAIVVFAQAFVPRPVEHWVARITSGSDRPLLSPSVQWLLLWWISLGIIAAKGLLVILVEPALGRYVAAVGCLIPALVGWCCGYLVQMVARSNHGSDS